MQNDNIITVDLTTYQGVIQSLNLALADYDIVDQTKTTITFMRVNNGKSKKHF